MSTNLLAGMKGVLGAAVVAGLFATLSIHSILQANREKSEHLNALTQAFSRTFNEHRPDGATDPSTLRRMALDTYTVLGSDIEGAEVSLQLPGLPGLEIITIAENQNVAGAIEHFDQTADLTPQFFLSFEEMRVVDRNVFPVVASNEGCVSCHTLLTSGYEWQLGDIMGGVVVSTDLTQAFLRIGAQTGVIFLAAMILFSALLRFEKRRGLVRLQALQEKTSKERRDADARIRFLAFNDQLTRIGNRTAFQDFARDFLDTGKHVVLAVVDADKFKEVNDNLGHGAGDVLLRAFADRLSAIATQRNGKAFRLGGDEFAIVLPETDEVVDLADLGQTMNLRCAQAVEAEGKQIHPSASIGIVSTRHLQSPDLPEALRTADFALYQSKEAGRGTYSVFEGEVKRKYATERTVRHALATAVENNEFEVCYQPQYFLENGVLRGVEALARWRQNGQLQSPDRFLRILEQSGQIRELDYFVLDTGLRQLADWQAQGLPPIQLSVNFSGAHFKGQSALVERVMATIDRHQIPPTQLILEITESLFVENFEVANELIKPLREQGIKISLDDFGTGFSSLAYLRKIHYDEIKIDRRFLTDVEDSLETRFLLDGVIDIVTRMKRDVVLEGIENRQQHLLVAALGAKIGQGYLFGRPTTAEETTKLIRENLTETYRRAAGKRL